MFSCRWPVPQQQRSKFPQPHLSYLLHVHGLPTSLKHIETARVEHPRVIRAFAVLQALQQTKFLQQRVQFPTRRIADRSSGAVSHSCLGVQVAPLTSPGRKMVHMRHVAAQS